MRIKLSLPTLGYGRHAITGTGQHPGNGASGVSITTAVYDVDKAGLEIISSIKSLQHGLQGFNDIATGAGNTFTVITVLRLLTRKSSAAGFQLTQACTVQGQLQQLDHMFRTRICQTGMMGNVRLDA